MKVVNMEIGKGLLSLAKEVNKENLRRELESVANIPNCEISRRERERLFVRKAIAFLPQNPRLILYLSFWENEKIWEIAETLDLSIGQVRKDYLIGLAYLERELSPYILSNRFFLKENRASA